MSWREAVLVFSVIGLGSLLVAVVFGMVCDAFLRSEEDP